MSEFEEDIGCIDSDLGELEDTVENLDNLQRKNNIKLRGLKENIEGTDLVGLLTQLFSGWVASNSDSDIKILTAQVGA